MRLIQQVPGHVHIGQDLRRNLCQLGNQPIFGDLGLAQTAPQGVVMHQNTIDFAAERFEVLQILHPDSASPNLVFIRRPNAAPRRADLTGTGCGFAQLIELAMQRQDQRRVFSDAQILARDDDLLRREFVDFRNQRPRIDDNAVADDGELARPHHARWQQRQLVRRAANNQRVAGVVTALKAHDNVGTLREPIDNLALALVAPLGTDNHNVGHLQTFAKLGPGDCQGP